LVQAAGDLVKGRNHTKSKSGRSTYQIKPHDMYIGGGVVQHGSGMYYEQE